MGLMLGNSNARSLLAHAYCSCYQNLASSAHLVQDGQQLLGIGFQTIRRLQKNFSPYIMHSVPSRAWIFMV